MLRAELKLNYFNKFKGEKNHFLQKVIILLNVHRTLDLSVQDIICYLSWTLSFLQQVDPGWYIVLCVSQTTPVTQVSLYKPHKNWGGGVD